MEKLPHRLSALLLAGSMLFCACVGEKEPETPEEFHAAMVERSLVSTGNACRLQRVMEEAQNGEQITIGYIGGSITEGLTVGDNGCYARLSYEAFAETYGQGANVHYVNAGLSGTSSVLGNLRAEEELFLYEPDLILIEFAVNDAQDVLHRNAYESLIRSCLMQENAPAVILIFTVLENGYTCQKHMEEIGDYYQLPMISVGDALTPELESGRMVWDDYSDDESHPNAEGHQLIAEFIAYCLETAASEKPVEYFVPEKILGVTEYADAQLLDSTELEVTLGSFTAGTSNGHFMNGFSFLSDGTNEPLTFSVDAKSLFLVYKQGNFKNYSMLCVSVNGHLEKVVSTYSTDGWEGPVIELIYEGITTETLDVEICMLESYERHTFEVLAVGISN